jgi:uncharacterized BrkB/YihY/UPF0761 family membrane protein/DNA-binding IscR family transcriptional regulator
MTSTSETVADTLVQRVRQRRRRIATSFWPRARLIGEILYHQIDRDRLFSQASALTYKTLFSLLPIFVLSLLILSTISAGDGKNALDNAVKRTLFEQMGIDRLTMKDSKGQDVLDEDGRKVTVSNFVEPLIEGAKKSVTNKATGLIAFAVLLYGAISLMIVIEGTFNQIYGSVKPRSWPRRIMLYWCVLTLGPLGVAASITLGNSAYAAATSVAGRASRLVAPAPPPSSAAPADAAPVEALAAPTPAPAPAPTPATAKAEPVHAPEAPLSEKAPIMFLSTVQVISGFIVSWVLILLLYRLIPDTHVNWRPAIIGSFLAAVAWEVGKWAFGLYVQRAVRNSWYGSLALLPLFMFWIYITWSVVLIGLEVTYIQQYWPLLKRRFFFTRAGGAGATLVSDLRWVLSIGVLVYKQFKQGKVTEVHEAAELLMLPNDITGMLLDGLENAGLMHEVREGAYALARPAESITAHDLLTAARALCQAPPELAKEQPHVRTYPVSPAVKELEELETAWAKSHALPALAGEGVQAS